MDLKRLYEIVIVEWGDPRSANNVMINTPFPMLIVLTFYIYFVFVFGPKLMKNRPPYNIDWLVSIYNCIQVIWNAILFYMGLWAMTEVPDDFDWFCIPPGMHENKTLATLFLYGGHGYFINKMFDLCDTCFFVLRKKFTHITTLHVFHHFIMVFGGWMYVKYQMSGNGFSLIFVNVFVHVVMYTYYQLTLMKYNTVKWKKHITQMQILQFLIVVVHNGAILFRNYCKQNIYIAALVVTQGIYMISLFTKFYINEYILKKKKTDTRKESAMETDHSEDKVEEVRDGVHKRISTKQSAKQHN